MFKHFNLLLKLISKLNLNENDKIILNDYINKFFELQFENSKINDYIQVLFEFSDDEKIFKPKKIKKNKKDKKDKKLDDVPINIENMPSTSDYKNDDTPKLLHKDNENTAEDSKIEVNEPIVIKKTTYTTTDVIDSKNQTFKFEKNINDGVSFELFIEQKLKDKFYQYEVKNTSKIPHSTDIIMIDKDKKYLFMFEIKNKKILNKEDIDKFNRDVINYDYNNFTKVGFMLSSSDSVFGKNDYHIEYIHNINKAILIYLGSSYIDISFIEIIINSIYKFIDFGILIEKDNMINKKDPRYIKILKILIDYYKEIENQLESYIEQEKHLDKSLIICKNVIMQNKIRFQLFGDFIKINNICIENDNTQLLAYIKDNNKYTKKDLREKFPLNSDFINKHSLNDLKKMAL